MLLETAVLALFAGIVVNMVVLAVVTAITEVYVAGVVIDVAQVTFIPLWAVGFLVLLLI